MGSGLRRPQCLKNKEAPIPSVPHGGQGKEQVYEVLDLPFIEPGLRNGRGGIERAS